MRASTKIAQIMFGSCWSADLEPMPPVRSGWPIEPAVRLRRSPGVLTYSAHSPAPASRAWALFARPDRWSRWAPHLRGAWGLGSPEVEPGRRGAVRLLGFVPIPATITAKRPGRSWSWRVGAVDMTHRVVPRPDGCDVRVEIAAPAPVEAMVRASYGPVIALLLRNLARVAT